MNNDIQNEIEINEMHDALTLFIVLLQLSESCRSRRISLTSRCVHLKTTGKAREKKAYHNEKGGFRC